MNNMILTACQRRVSFSINSHFSLQEKSEAPRAVLALCRACHLVPPVLLLFTQTPLAE